MKIILALAAAALVFTTVVSGLTPVAPSASVYAKKCAKSACRERCTGRCIQSICDTCEKP